MNISTRSHDIVRVLFMIISHLPVIFKYGLRKSRREFAHANISKAILWISVSCLPKKLSCEKVIYRDKQFEIITFYITYRWSKVFSVCRLYSIYNENLVTRKCEEIMWHCSRFVFHHQCVSIKKKKGKERKNGTKKEQKREAFLSIRIISSAKRVRRSRIALVS